MYSLGGGNAQDIKLKARIPGLSAQNVQRALEEIMVGVAEVQKIYFEQTEFSDTWFITTPTLFYPYPEVTITGITGIDSIPLPIKNVRPGLDWVDEHTVILKFYFGGKLRPCIGFAICR